MQLQDDFPLVYQNIGTLDIFREDTQLVSVLPVPVEGDGKAREPDCRVDIHTTDNADRDSTDRERHKAYTSPQHIHVGRTNEEACVSKNTKLDVENRGIGEKEKGRILDEPLLTLISTE